MVILSTGLEPGEKSTELAKKLGIKTQPNGFIWTESLNPLRTSREGVFVGGAASGPKDIPETVTQASGTVSEAMGLLGEVRNTLTTERQYPAEKDLTSQAPRVGVFVCHCGINIGGVVDVPGTTEYAKGLHYVVHAEESIYTCSQDTQEHIKEVIDEYDLNRVVVASCSPRTHEPLFQQTLREAGLNPHLFEMANIRDQCSWIHMNEPEKATEKAKELVAMAVAKVVVAEPLESEILPVTHSAMVIGSGAAGLTAALSIAEGGFDAVVIERQKQLGGNLNRLKYTLSDSTISDYLKELIDKVNKHNRINVYTDAKIKDVDGFVGNFQSTIACNGKEITIKHGAVVVATGGNESVPAEYLYGKNKKVLTQFELEEKLCSGKKFKADRVVMIQCVGSREEGHMYCSRVCCSTAVKNALKIKELSPDTEIYVLYRDMRTYGFNELYYQQARDKGVVFIRYEVDSKPIVSNNGSLKVSVNEPMLNREIILDADMIVLSSRIDANSDNDELAQMLKVPLNEDGFFLEAHVKLRPVEFATEGVLVAGLAHSPKSLPETIAQAKAAAAKACTIIGKDFYEGEPRVACVDAGRCSACGTCVHVCAYKAIEIVTIDEKRGIISAKVNPALCKGCGTCAATCRSGAVDVKGIADDQINRMIKSV